MNIKSVCPVCGEDGGLIHVQGMHPSEYDEMVDIVKSMSAMRVGVEQIASETGIPTSVVLQARDDLRHDYLRVGFIKMSDAAQIAMLSSTAVADLVDRGGFKDRYIGHSRFVYLPDLMNWIDTVIHGRKRGKFTCSACGRRFNESGAMSAHWRRIHKPEEAK